MLFGFIKNMFTELLAGIVNVSNQTKCISLSNQPCMIEPTLTDLKINELFFCAMANRRRTFSLISSRDYC